MDLQISLFKGVKDTKGTPIAISAVIDLIRSDTGLKKQVENLRTFDKAKYDENKKYLPAVTWSCLMNGKGRTAATVEKYSALICLDVDKLTDEQLATTWEIVIAQPTTYLAFVSPSGKGLKFIVQVPLYRDGHLQFFQALETFYAEKGVTLDTSGKDVNRLCFLSYDPDLYINANCETFELPKDKKPTKETKAANAAVKKQVDKQTKIEAKKPSNDLDKIYKFTSNKVSYSEGNHNNFIYLFACNCNRKGVDISTCLTYVTGFATGRDISEVGATVESGYKHHSTEASKFEPRRNANAGANVSKASPAPAPPKKKQAENTTAPDVDIEFTQFWFEDIQESKTTGKVKTVIEISYRNLMAFLSENGFNRLALSETGYELVRCTGNVVKRVQAYQVRDFIVSWAAERNNWALEEKLRRSNKGALSNDQINTLPFIAVEFKKDTAAEAFFYFKNCWVSVSKNGITTKEYTELDKAIWATQIKPREFTKLDNWVIDFSNPNKVTCEYARFLLLACHNRHTEEKNDLQLIGGRFDSFCTAFGYMLHSFKNPSNAKMILSVDHKIGEKGEQNGGSGKSLAGKAVAELKHTTNISGKDFKEDYPFKYEAITPDSQLVSFNDLRKNFNLESLFELITGEFTINRRNIGYLTFPFETSPKIYGNTNFVMPGEGASFLRRMHIIEFSDFFNEEHTPYEEFGHNLFIDWDDAEYNRFFNFMLQNCVSLYLQDGLVKYPGSNYDQRKLQSEVPEEFIDFLDQTATDGTMIIARNICHKKMELLEKFREFTKGSGMKDPTSNSFTRWMKKYCKTNQFKWNAHNDEKRDSSGPYGEFISICDADFNLQKCLDSRGTMLFSNQKN